MNAKNSTMNACCSRTLGLFLGSIAMLLSVPAYALSLGAFQVKSTLDQPLKAEIPVQSAGAATLKSLKVSLATPADFKRADVPRPNTLNELKFTLKTEGGTPMIEVTTDKPIKEPFLHFLISAQWSGGKLIREYTGLLDPPMYAASEPSAVKAPEAAAAAKATNAGATESTSSESTSTSSASTAATSAATGEASAAGSSGRSAEYGPTQKGDTLWAIASKLDTGSLHVNVFQVMIALLRQNPGAFIDHNINLLKTGETLHLKDISTVADISAKAASIAYASQLQQWQAYRTRVASAAGQGASEGSVTVKAGTSKTAAAANGTASTAEASNKPSSSGQAAETGQGNVLRIVRASTGKSAKSQSAGAGSDQGSEIAALRGQINTLQDALDSKNLENKDLSERVRLLESQVKNAKRLVNIQDQELAAAQAQASATTGHAQQGASEPVVAAADTSADSSGTKVGSQATDQAPDASTTVADSTQDTSLAPATTQVDVKPKREISKSKAGAQKAGVMSAGAAPKRVSHSSQERPRVRKVMSGTALASWWGRIPDLLFSSWMWMVGAGAGVLVLVLGLLMFLRRRQSIAEFEESILSGSALDSYSETTDTAGTSASDTSFLSDFGTAGMGTMQADEVDPLAEAEVYLAYGRDEQAEDVLKEAARRDPDRSEIKLKLLEIYKQRNDVKSFETIAEELYPAGDRGDRGVWGKVVAMGREVNPNNPLFQESGQPAGASTPAAPSAARRAPPPADPAPGAAAASRTGTAGSPGANPASLSGGSGTPMAPRELGAGDLDAGLNDLPSAASSSGHNEGTLDFGDDLIERSSRNVDPATQPFPAPDQQTDLDRELERLASEREATPPADVSAGPALETVDAEAASPELDWDRAEAETSTLDFPSSDSSEIEFDLNLDESSIQHLSTSDTRTGQETAGARRGSNGGRRGGNGEGVMEFESEHIPPQETWAGPSTDASPPSDDDVISYSPEEDVHSAAAPQYNEAETKLDLARAYLDMGDKVGARSIIDEVMREGDPAQRDQAAELASQL